MAEKRKPVFIFLLKNIGKKTNKVEVFDSKKWNDGYIASRHQHSARYRIRVNGRWYKINGRKYCTKTELRDALWRSIHLY